LIELTQVRKEYLVLVSSRLEEGWIAYLLFYFICNLLIIINTKIRKAFSAKYSLQTHKQNSTSLVRLNIFIYQILWNYITVNGQLITY